MQFPGGNAVNVAVLCRRLGVDASYIGCLGEDEGGSILMEALIAEGVDVSRVRRIPGENARAKIMHEHGDRRFVGSKPGVRARYDFHDEDFVFVAQHDLVHTTINSDLDDALARIARSANRLSYDFSEKWTPERLASTLPLIDFAFLSAPRRSDTECEALLEQCLAYGTLTTVVTRGVDGTFARSRDRTCRQSAVPTRIVDTLGAGDGFIAGFLVAQLGGASLGEACGAGAAYAARVCTWQGAFGHARAWSAE